MGVPTYSPEQVSISLNGLLLTGYTDGDFIAVAREEDGFTKVTGADGTTSRAKNANRSGSITLTLKASSPANDILTAIASADEINGRGVGPTIVKDNSGTTILAGTGWIRKFPDVAFGKEVGDREWIIDVASLTMVVGGNTEV